MDKVKKYLNYISSLLILACLATWMIWPQKKTLILVLAAAGFVSLISYLGLNFAVLKQGFKRRAFIYSGNLALMIIIVLGIVVLVNYFSARHHYRVDLTVAKRYSLSDQTRSVLKNLKKEVHFKCFFREGHFGRQTMENLLKIYAYQSNRIKYEFIDPDKNPSLVKRYSITQDGTTIIEAGEKENRITTTTEEDITNALIKVTREKKKVLYFLEGHGEDSIDDAGDSGFATMKSELEKLGYEVKKQTLALADNFPSDCDTLVIPGPQKNLLPNELETLRNYLNHGGRAFFMVDPETAPDLTPFFAEYGIQLDNDVVVDTVSRLLGGDYFMPVVSEYEPHAITARFRYATFFPLARSVQTIDKKPEGLTVTELAKTSPNSWAERQLNEKAVKFDKDKDKPGPINIASAVTFKAKEPEALSETEKGETRPTGQEARIVVVGDSDFIKNQYYGLSGNGNFGLNIINWLTEEADLISIQPRTENPRTMTLTPSQMRLVNFVILYFLPFGTFLLGIYIWLRRRAL